MPCKVKAGALLLVLVISLIASAVLGSLVMLAYYRRLSLARTDLQHKVQANARSGLQYLLATQGEGREGPATLDLFGDGEAMVQLNRTPWGVFDVLVSEAQQGGAAARKAALVGVVPGQELRLALYLCDEDRPLALSGRTLLRGDCRLPKAGVRAVYVDQSGFSGPRLVEGNVADSQKQLPAIHPAFLKRVKGHSRRLNNQLPPLPLSPISKYNQQHVSFFGEGGMVRSEEALRLSGIHLSGKVLVTSDKPITIARSAKLDKVVVAAPVIRVEEGFSGSVQLFASDTIILGPSCRLTYPSALCTYSKGKGRVTIGEGSEVTGVVYLGGEGELLQNILTVGKGATVMGFVYADGFVEHRGTILGGLYCRRFLHQTLSTLYENHLVDASVDATLLPPAFLAAQLLPASKQWGVVAWVE
jgi:hypothetical protein